MIAAGAVGLACLEKGPVARTIHLVLGTPAQVAWGRFMGVEALVSAELAIEMVQAAPRAASR